MGKIAMCACDEPLVMTFLYRGKEFYCVQCGATYTFCGPTGAEETPERLARMEELRATFRRLADGILITGGFLDRCEQCSRLGKPHDQHATPDEIDADRAARRRLLDHIARAQGVEVPA